MKKHGYFAGIDSGSATTDVVILDQDRTIVAKGHPPHRGGASGAQRALDQALQQAGLTQADLTATVTTGYGRGTGDKSVTEITCHGQKSTGKNTGGEGPAGGSFLGTPFSLVGKNAGGSFLSWLAGPISWK